MTLSKRRTTVKRIFMSLILAAAASVAIALGVGIVLKQIGGDVVVKAEDFFLFAFVSAIVIFLFSVHPANRPLRFFKNIGRLLLLVILVGMVWAYAFLWVGQGAILYPPVHINSGAEEALKASPNAQQITVSGLEGESYNGWFLKDSAEQAGVVLYFGGNGEESAGRVQAMSQPSSRQMLSGYHFLMLDYPGTARSPGERSEESMMRMARAAWDYAVAREDVNKDRIVLAGWSLGTGTAVRLAGEQQPAGLILFAPYFSGSALTNSFLESLLDTTVKIPLPIRNPYRSDHHAKGVQSPTLVVAARDDGLVPYEQSQRLAALFPSAQLVTLESGGHGAMWQDQSSLSAVQVFLAGL
ncbi:MAG: alpha/beta fold hydrolase [Eubacteriales bacterium]|nr:alpha/beta fold hydrolase [Eubacteriales bacterium]